DIARANADLKVAEAEAYQRAETRHREAEASVLEAQYRAQARAAEAEAEKIEAETRAHLESVSKAEKAKTIVDAEASAARVRIAAEGEAAAIFARLDAEARGQFEILTKKGQGLEAIVKACGGSQEAFQMMMLEHMDHLAETAASAISNIKFDKVVVWDGGQSNDGSGSNATGNFIKGIAHSLPPMMQIMKDVGGVKMPEFFGKLVEDEDGPPEAPAVGKSDGDAPVKGSKPPAKP
ncbi:MAG: flotillin, partial [Planctomycetota bacterium]